MKDIYSKGYYYLRGKEKQPQVVFKCRFNVNVSGSNHDLQVGEIFTARDGMWYIKVDEKQYRAWYWYGSTMKE
jgi:hypothetical protein